MTEKASDLQQTPLHDLHVELGARMVPFAGYQMPVQYQGIIQEHLHTRAQAGLFDVSHMGQIIVRGPEARAGLEALVPVDLEQLPINKQTYALFTNDQGGILDDLMIMRLSEDSFYLVVNAACKEQDLEHLQKELPASCDIEPRFERGLLALQGPTAKDVMAELVPSTSELIFMQGCDIELAGHSCFVSRSGYTGEDGFEISVPASGADEVARLLLADERVAPIGLGARDSLRLEAGLCLYGHDLNEETTPVEGALNWSISPSRRAGGDKEGGFPGAEIILQQMQNSPEQIQNKTEQKRVGFKVEGKAPVREGAEIITETGETIGRMSSGGFAPSLEQPIAMGYVQTQFAQPGQKLQALVRGKPKPIEVVKTPFVPQRYFRG